MGKKLTKIPEEAKCVFKGVLFEIYNWEQEQYDGSIKTFEMARMPSWVNIITVTKNKKIIVLEEEQPLKGNFLNSVAGGIEKDEEPIECAKRELLEETGYSSEEFIQYDSNAISSKVEACAYYFIAKDCVKIEEQKLDSGEKINVRFVDFDEFLEITQRDDFRDKYLQNKIFRMIYTKGEIEKFKKMLFE